MRALSYEKTGTLKTPRKVIERLVFKDMTTQSIIFGSLIELYKRFNTELYAFGFFGMIALEIYHRLGR